jgi:hypothetical protein
MQNNTSNVPLKQKCFWLFAERNDIVVVYFISTLIVDSYSKLIMYLYYIVLCITSITIILFNFHKFHSGTCAFIDVTMDSNRGERKIPESDNAKKE